MADNTPAVAPADQVANAIHLRLEVLPEFQQAGHRLSYYLLVSVFLSFSGRIVFARRMK